MRRTKVGVMIELDNLYREVTGHTWPVSYSIAHRMSLPELERELEKAKEKAAKGEKLL